MLNLGAQITESANFLSSRCSVRPRVGMILGSGLGGFARQVTIDVAVAYGEIPHFPTSTVIGHKGQWLSGQVAGVPVVVMEGRFHHYEGYGIAQVTFPIRVMRHLGVKVLIVSNASGGLNPHYRSGDIMVIEDHLNMMFRNPLIGMNDDALGPRFPDMSEPYDRTLIEQSIEIARQAGFTAHRGVYAALTGPTYETRAEYRMLRSLGADVVGMSTVPEVIVAVHAGIRVLALSAVTNLCRPDALEDTSGEEVVEAARGAEPKMTTIVLGVLKRLAETPCEFD